MTSRTTIRCLRASVRKRSDRRPLPSRSVSIFVLQSRARKRTIGRGSTSRSLFKGLLGTPFRCIPRQCLLLRLQRFHQFRSWHICQHHYPILPIYHHIHHLTCMHTHTHILIHLSIHNHIQSRTCLQVRQHLSLQHLSITHPRLQALLLLLEVNPTIGNVRQVLMKKRISVRDLSPPETIDLRSASTDTITVC